MFYIYQLISSDNNILITDNNVDSVKYFQYENIELNKVTKTSINVDILVS